MHMCRCECLTCKMRDVDADRRANTKTSNIISALFFCITSSDNRYNLGMSIDIRKSRYRISGTISGYENSQTISENNKWMASHWSLRRRRWREMCVDTVTLNTLAASSSSRCMWCSVQSLGGGGWVNASCKVSLSGHAAAAATPPAGRPLHTDHPLSQRRRSLLLAV